MKVRQFAVSAPALFATFAVWAAYIEKVGDITWTYTIKGDGAEVGDGSHSAIPNMTTGAITIPSTLGGKPVTSIGDSAFYGCSMLRSVLVFASNRRQASSSS